MTKQTRKPLSEETKKKISESIKEAYETGRKNKINSGCFQKGFKHSEEHKQRMSKVQKQRCIDGIHNAWKDGGSRPHCYKVMRDSGMEIRKCWICGDDLINQRRIIHHIDGNERNNDIINMCELCDFCHNAIHDTPNKRRNRFGGEPILIAQ